MRFGIDVSCSDAFAFTMMMILQSKTKTRLTSLVSNQTSKPTLEKSHAEILTSAVDGAENKEVSGNGVASASS